MTGISLKTKVSFTKLFNVASTLQLDNILPEYYKSDKMINFR